MYFVLSDFSAAFSSRNLSAFLKLVNSGGSRAAATSKMKRFVIIVNGLQPTVEAIGRMLF